MTEQLDLDTPLGVESAIRRLITAETQAQRELAQCRDLAVCAKLDYRSAKRRSMFDAECPKVGRGGVTVDERAAWIEARCEDLERAFELAEATRDAAQDKLRVLRDSVTLLVTLSASVRQAYEISGHAA